VVADVPRLPSGKPDRQTAMALAARVAHDAAPRSTVTDVRALYQRLLGRTDVDPTDSFVSMGADSLSYVELSVRLGELIDPLPRDWHRRSVAELERLAQCRPERARTIARLSVDTTILLRAVAIVLIVGTHANLLTVMGGAHALLAVCGYNAARFLPTGHSPTRALVRGAWNVALPSALWIGTLAAFGFYKPTTAVFLNGALGEDRWTTDWQFWFLEAAIWTLVGMAVALSIRPLRRLDAAHPFASALLLLAGTAALRYVLVGVDTDPVLPERYSTPVVAWCFVLGWAAARATTQLGRWTVLGSSVLLLHGFFGDPRRELLVVAAIAVLLWARPVRLPRWMARAVGALAAASLAIYLTHWQVYPHLEDRYPLLATLSSLVVGLTYHRLCGLAGRVVTSLRRRIALYVNRRVQGRADEHGDRQDVEQEQHRDRSRQWAIDRRSDRTQAQHPAHKVAAHDPHEEREDGARDTLAPRLSHRDRQVVEGRHEADREHENGRPVHTL
jgi:hypothetical protein